ncbi:hypothetical protein SCLCIDRAFT_368913 [Scleroderma citrinum Foug A]|uniref:Uncharacterized protein n=1 Tax=Scleroderma citrinum Foug A TaxID=1036808 RepID=A0A0C3AMX4_9AGAM|nr:hypothetical protein SCLCIDRAFT_368913 [Scleroderma citrinum Foug A]
MVIIRDLLGSTPSADNIADYLATVAQHVSVTDALVPDVKVYPDVVYFNYYRLGISLQFAPQLGYKPTVGQKREQLKDEQLILEGIDVYNDNANPGTLFSSYPLLPLEILLDASLGGRHSLPSTISIAANTTGKELVSWLGEPSRKGGGAGPLSGSINIWCEWSKDGLMVEFGGEESRGPQAWERGKDAVWRVVTVFPPKEG